MAYKSEYYDPKKAHEYYIKHRKLKGKRSKTSIAGFSKKQKEASMYDKNRIKKKQKKALAKHTEDTKNKREQYSASVKQQREQMRVEVSNKLSDIQKKIKQINGNSNLSNNQKAELRGALKEQLGKIKEDYASKKEQFNEGVKAGRQKISDEAKNKRKKIKKAYQKKYEKEHKKIKNDSSMKQPKTTRNSAKTTTKKKKAGKKKRR